VTATIPAGLFSGITTAGGTNFTSMFQGTFTTWSANTAATIPAGLFSSITTPNGTTFNLMFSSTFQSWSANVNATIPSGLFDGITGANGTNFTSMFQATFTTWSANTAATIPAGLFANLSTANGTIFTGMFANTFQNWISDGVATIPAGLFANLNLEKGTNFTNLFNSTFLGWQKTQTTIPADLFAFTMTTTGANAIFTNMFFSTFQNWAADTAATIPSGLFANLHTTNGTTFTGMFYYTFASWSANTTVTIPSGLFNSLDTSNGTAFNQMFQGTFTLWSANITATIPSGLFGNLDTTHATTLNSMFQQTFQSWNVNTIATIPTDLFSAITVPAGATTTSIYRTTFSTFARRTATFRVGAGYTTIANTFSIASPYATTNVTTGDIANSDPIVNSGNVVVPTYVNMTGTITAPGGAYATYRWYYKDGTSCSAAPADPDCGVQDATTLALSPSASMPASTIWNPSTPTDRVNSLGNPNLTLYGVAIYTVTFNANGGAPTPAAQSVNSGSVISRPTDPTLTDFTFGGWYSDSDCVDSDAGYPATCVTPWDFANDTVTSTITLHAKWTVTTYTVSFNTNGGSAVTSQTVDTAVPPPSRPTRPALGIRLMAGIVTLV
jgi:hypothetical protein